LGRKPVSAGSGLMSKEETEARKKAAERGRLADPPPLPHREMIPGEENQVVSDDGCQEPA
jgi:hypothetical protein